MIDVDARAGLDMLRRLVDSVDNPRPLLDALAGDVRDYVGDMFATGGRGAWPKLNPATVRGKGNARILIDDGGLAASLTGARGDFGAESVTIASDEISGIMAQRGARGAPKRNPTPEPSAADRQAWAEHLLRLMTAGAGS